MSNKANIEEQETKQEKKAEQLVRFNINFIDISGNSYQVGDEVKLSSNIIDQLEQANIITKI